MKVIPEITRESISKIIKSGERIDGRKSDEYREISVETDVVSKAEGSARVKIGNTQVYVGVKPTIGEPFGDTPNLGVIMTNTELLPMASPEFEPGPPNENSIELSRVVDRCIRESEMVDLEKLCIEPGKKVWMLFVDIHVIDYDGNLFDAATLAAVSALSTAKIPKATYVDDEVVIDEDNTEALPIRRKVALNTFVKIGDNELIVDPSLAEEEILDARISIGITTEGNICAMQKGGDNSLTQEEIVSAVKSAFDLTKKLFEYY